MGGDGGDDEDDEDEEMSECEDGERSEAAVTAAAEEMDTETPEEARWAMGGPEEGGGEGLSLRDLLPHNANDVSLSLLMERSVVEPVRSAASRLTLKGSGLGGESCSFLRERSTPTPMLWRAREEMVGTLRTTPEIGRAHV